jgi:hypothetical protein
VEACRLWDVQDLTLPRESTHRWRWDCQPYAPAALYSQEDSWYSYLLEAESTPGPYCDWKLKVRISDLIENGSRDLQSCNVVPWCLVVAVNAWVLVGASYNYGVRSCEAVGDRRRPSTYQHCHLVTALAPTCLRSAHLPYIEWSLSWICWVATWSLKNLDAFCKARSRCSVLGSCPSKHTLWVNPRLKNPLEMQANLIIIANCRHIFSKTSSYQDKKIRPY